MVNENRKKMSNGVKLCIIIGIILIICIILYFVLNRYTKTKFCGDECDIDELEENEKKK